MTDRTRTSTVWMNVLCLASCAAASRVFQTRTQMRHHAVYARRCERTISWLVIFARDCMQAQCMQCINDVGGE
jgi:hypothetical protein